MKAIVIAFTKNGGALARNICDNTGADGFVISKYHTDGLRDFDNLTALVNDAWQNYNALIFVGACGIAVRAVAPHLEDKAKDPAVVVIDEKGGFIIPLLSGHIGGANDLAKKIAALTNGTAVITTATDINNKFSADTFAVKNNLHIGDTKMIKEISSRVLDGYKIGLYSDYELKNIPGCFSDGAEAGICISGDTKAPFPITLNLYPKNIVLGIGCRKNCESVEESIIEFLRSQSIDINRLCAVATIDKKKDEKGINDFCDKYSLPLLTFTAEELGDTKGEFSSSEFVKQTVGVDNVCERAAARAGARLTHKKTAVNGVTIAAGETEFIVDFEGQTRKNEGLSHPICP